MIVKCPYCGEKYERFNFDLYAGQDCPNKCMGEKQ